MSIIGACHAALDSVRPFETLSVSFDIAGTKTTGTHPNQQTATYSLDGGPFTYSFSTRFPWFGLSGSPGLEANLPSDNFSVLQLSCCCQCQWSILLRDSGYLDTASATFQRGLVPGIITQSNPRMRTVTTFENGSPTTTTFDNLNITIVPYDGTATGPCNRYPGGAEPDYGGAASAMSVSGINIGCPSGTTVTETTTSCGSASVVTRTSTGEFLDFSTAVPMKTCLDTQTYEFKKEFAGTNLSATAVINWSVT